MIQEIIGHRNISFLSTGFSGIPHTRYFSIFLFIAYFVYSLGNYCLMFIIMTDRRLYAPKYITVLNLSLTDNSTAIPKRLDALLSGNQSHRLCVSLTFVILSFDSLIAICLTLMYDTTVSHRSMLVIIALLQTVFMNRAFGRSSVIIVHVCDCGSFFSSCVITTVLFQLIVLFPGLFIFSYKHRAVTLFKIEPPQDPHRATKTCNTTGNLTSTQSNSSANVAFVRPATFFISGFSNIPHAKYYYLFLCFVYAVTLLGNLFIMSVIYLSRRLHTAKYIAVFNLAFSDLCGSSALIPKLIDMFLFEHQYISYEACLMNMFFVFHFMNVQSLTLLALAYDRLVAICFPLKYHVIINKTSMSLILGSLWIFSLTLFAVLVGLVNRLSFCRSTVVNSYFCDHGPVISLSCNSNFINYLLAYIFFGLLICMPVLLITLSYCCIAAALLKIAHGADRIKAMKTCTSHLMLVAIFYLPILSVNVKSITTSIDQNSRIINNSLTQILPPMLNPIIYTLKTEEVMQSIKDLYKRHKVHTILERNAKQRK